MRARFKGQAAKFKGQSGTWSDGVADFAAGTHAGYDHRGWISHGDVAGGDTAFHVGLSKSAFSRRARALPRPRGLNEYCGHFADNLVYLNIHTSAHGGGEICAHVLP
jgi:hypothetical protein